MQSQQVPRSGEACLFPQAETFLSHLQISRQLGGTDKTNHPNTRFPHQETPMAGLAKLVLPTHQQRPGETQAYQINQADQNKIAKVLDIKLPLETQPPPLKYMMIKDPKEK